MLNAPHSLKFEGLLCGRKRTIYVGLEFVLGIVASIAFVIAVIAFTYSRVSTLDGPLREYYIAVEER